MIRSQTCIAKTHFTLYSFWLYFSFIQRNQGHTDPMMHEFNFSINKVTNASTKVKAIGERLPLKGAAFGVLFASLLRTIMFSSYNLNFFDMIHNFNSKFSIDYGHGPHYILHANFYFEWCFAFGRAKTREHLSIFPQNAAIAQ